MSETWRQHRGFVGYEVSDRGSVRSVRKQLTPIISHNGYPYVNLTDASGKRMPRYLHHLVWEAFVGQRDGRVIRHLNDTKTDNRLCNLAIGTDQDNFVDSFINGKRQLAVPFAAIADIRAKRAAGLSLRKIAVEYGVAHATIRRIAHLPSSYSDERLVAHFQEAR